MPASMAGKETSGLVYINVNARVTQCDTSAYVGFDDLLFPDQNDANARRCCTATWVASGKQERYLNLLAHFVGSAFMILYGFLQW